MKRDWRQVLKDHYTGTLDQGFQQFRQGVSFFFLGLVGLYMANSLLEPSIEQELAVLVSLFILGGGFIWAMMAHLRMLIGRIILFIKDN